MLVKIQGIFCNPQPRTQLSEEENRRHFEIGKTYNKNMATRHNVENCNLTWKIKLRDDAIEALPSELQEHAKEADLTPCPLWRRMATVTPPIPGFDATAWAKKLGQTL